jgi:HD-like signal output (HDOD) protein
MVLASDVRAPDGRTILGTGSRLTDRTIRMFRVWGIESADVEGETDESLERAASARAETLRRAEGLVALWMPPPPEETLVAARTLHASALREAAARTASLLESEGRIPAAWVPPRAPSEEEVLLGGGGAGPRAEAPETEQPTLMRDLVAREVRLVSFPDIYFKIREVIDNPLSSARHIAEVVSKDPALTVRLLRLVNSSYYGFPKAITSIPRAVAIIGSNQLTSLALAVSALSVFRNVPGERVDVKSFWLHSVAVGVFARILAFRRRTRDEERHFLAGLLHDVGRIVLYNQVPWRMNEALALASAEGIPLFRAERELLGFDHADLARRLLAAWNIPENIRELSCGHHGPDPASADEAGIHVADFLAGALRHGSSGSLFAPPVDPAAAALLDLDEGAVEAVCAQADRQIREIRKIFLVG